MAAVNEHLVLSGAPAFSSFRLVELADSINRALPAGPRLSSIASIHLHYVCASSPDALRDLRSKSSESRRILSQLVEREDGSTAAASDPETALLEQIVDGQAPKDGENRLLLYITPRKGTITPWSSKATSIAHVCGLDRVVRRIERGVLVSLAFDGELKEKSWPFADALYDRMTEVRLTPGQRSPQSLTLHADAGIPSPGL